MPSIEDLDNTPQPENTVEFRLKGFGQEVLRLDGDGFHYKGQTISDAGEAYRLFMNWMNKANLEQRNEQS